MTDKEKLIKIKSLADKMSDTAFNMTTDASLLKKAMDEYHQFIINEYHKEEQIIKELQEEPVSEDLDEEELDEAANKYAIDSYPDEPSTGQFGTGDYEPYVDMSGQREYAVEDFKAGAKWQKEHLWKPSEEMLEALYRVIPENVMAISEDEMLLDKLYQGLKYGRVLSKN